jgi:hypothetical protein
MAETRLVDRLTASDLFMLWADDFGWSQDIGVLAILDGTRLLDRDGRVRIQAVRRHIEPRLHLVPRFRQLLYRPRRGLGWPLWVDTPSFDLADHVRVRPLAAPGDQARLLQACAQLYRRHLDPRSTASLASSPPRSRARPAQGLNWSMRDSAKRPPRPSYGLPCRQFGTSGALGSSERR